MTDGLLTELMAHAGLFDAAEGHGEIEHGVVMLRTQDRARTLARVPAHDRQTLAHLLDMDRSPVGSSGAISRAGDGMLEWRIT